MPGFGFGVRALTRRRFVRSGLPTPPPVFTTQPSTSGTPRVGQSLTGNDGTILNGVASARRWLLNGSVISGATGPSYIPVTGDAGGSLVYQVTATGTGGSVTANAPALIVLPLAPANTVAPAVSGTPTVGSTLTTTTGTWSNSPTGYGYQWRQDGVDIAGATAASFGINVGNAGHSLACRVAASNAGGSASAASNALTANFAGVLPAVSASYAAVYAATAVASGYAGPLFRAVRLSDSATLDVSPATSDGWPDLAALDAWAPGGYTQDIWYDQTGKGCNATQTAGGNRPLADKGYDAVNGGRRGINMYGTQWLNTPTSLVLDRANRGHFLVAFRKAAFTGAARTFLDFNNGSSAQSAINTGGTLGMCDYTGSNSASIGGNRWPEYRMQTIGFVANAGARAFFLSGVKKTTNATSSVTLNTGGTIGRWTGYANTQMDMFLRVDMSAPPTDTDMATLDTWAKTRFPITVPSSIGNQLVVDLDSWGEGIVVKRNVLIGYTALDRSVWTIHNLSYTGRTIATAYANRGNPIACIDTNKVKRVYLMEPPLNDINLASSFASQAAAESAADAFYAQYLTAGGSSPFVTAMKTAGFTAVVVPTMPASGNLTFANFKEYWRLRWNANVRAGAATNGYIVSDRAWVTAGGSTGSGGAGSPYDDPARATSATNATYYQDNLHPSEVTGHTLIGTVDAAAILTA